MIPPEDRPLTSVPWGLREAFALVLLTIAVVLGSAILVAQPAFERLATRAPELWRGGAVLGVYAVLLAVVWRLARLRGERLRPAVGLWPISPSRALGLGVTFAVLARLLAFAWVFLLQLLHVRLPGESGVDVTRLLPLTPLGIALTVVLAVVAAPLTEEIVFRGVLVSALARGGRESVAFVVSAALFAGLHFNLFTLVPIFFLGLALAWLFVRTGSLWPSVAAHAAFNAVALLAAYALRFAS